VAPRRDIRHAARRTVPALACGRQDGTELDILLQQRRDKAATKRLFKRVMASCPTLREIANDQPRSYSAAKADVPEIASVTCMLSESQNVHHNFLRV
jgi:transposase-like protein